MAKAVGLSSFERAFDAPVGTVWEWNFRNMSDMMLMLDGHVSLLQLSNAGEKELKPFRRYYSLLHGRVASFSQDSAVNANAWPVE